MEFLAMLYTVLLVAICLMMALLLFRSGRPTGGLDEADCEELKDWLEEQLAAQAREFNARQDAIAQQNYAAIRSVSETLQTAVQSMSTTLGQGQDSQQRILERRLQSLEQANNQQMEQLRRAMVESMTALQAENTRKLDEIRHTVDEQLQDALQKRVTESFKAVNQQLEQVYKGLGEMQTLAAGVGDLKKVLSNVKTRGILGEIQLGAILEQILSPEQYAENVATVRGSAERVEYAVRLPGDGEEPVWLPIDAKFPADAYGALLEAYDAADAAQVEATAKALEQRVKTFAKDIHTKYVHVPETTEFGVMFVPIEGLYAELVRRGMVESLQTQYKVVLAGPTTMAALLNSLQMGFRTLAIQKRSSEVWQVLGAVKSEFETFGEALAQAQKRIELAGADLEKLVGVRTRQIQRKLRTVTALPQGSETEEA